MDEAELNTRALAWSRYWRSGTRHSCPGSFSDHYGPVTQAFWRRRFECLAAADRVLELGCGNGSLIRWLAGSGIQWPARIDAVDLAELDESWFVDLPAALRGRVQLYPRTAATRLPQGAATVQGIFSQYALEYFAGENCWAEISRVLAPRAVLAAIVHHRGSHLCTLAAAEAADSEWLLAEDGPLECAFGLLPWLAMSATAQDRARRDADPRALATRQRFNAVFARLGERIAAASFPDLLRDTADAAMRILERVPASGEESARRALETLRADLVDNRLRVAELVECALDRAGVEAWASRLRQMGFASVEIGEIVEQGYLFGWWLVASRGSKE